MVSMPPGDGAPAATPTRNVVVFCIDATYLLPCAFMIDQLAGDPSRDGYDVVVVHDGLDDARAEELKRRARRPVQLLAMDSDLLARLNRPHVGYLSHAVYQRIYLDTLLPARYERILYLDADMYFERHELMRLFRMDLGGAPLAAVDDALMSMELFFPQLLPDTPPRAWRGPHGIAAYRGGLGLAEGAPYFNSGLILIDRSRWRALEVEERAVAFLQAHPERCLLADQSALNAVTAGLWVELSARYNFQTMQAQAGLGALLPPAIRHFTGPFKPWNSGNWAQAIRDAYRSWLAASGWSIGFPGLGHGVAPPGERVRGKRPRRSWLERLRLRPRAGEPDDLADHRHTFGRALLAGMRDAPFVDFDAAARTAFLDAVARWGHDQAVRGERPGAIGQGSRAQVLPSI